MKLFFSANLLSFLLFISTSALAYRDVSWTPRSEGGDLALARALAVLAKDEPNVTISEPIAQLSDIVYARCSVDVNTPLIGEERRAYRGNRALCIATISTHKQVEISWDLSDEVLVAWGSRTFPRGFSFHGSSALKLFHAFAAVQKHEELPYLHFDDVALASAFSVYQYIEYTIHSKPKLADGQSDGNSLLNCLQEFHYPIDQVRPEKPDTIRCDFVYCLRDDSGGRNQCYE